VFQFMFGFGDEDYIVMECGSELLSCDCIMVAAVIVDNAAVIRWTMDRMLVLQSPKWMQIDEKTTNL